MANEVRVRYAPSPTGYLHIGNARTALFNYIYARSKGGKFIIRIEDTDQKRNIKGGEESQLTYLKWLGIDWDESIDVGGEYGPYRQMERLDIYKKYYEELLSNGKAYKCYCTEEELEASREEQMAKNETPVYNGRCRHLTAEQEAAFVAEGRKPSIRFAVQADRQYEWDDMVKGSVSFDSNGIGDFVIVKKDGIPTYNFAVAADDHDMAISHVLRGDDHISNTPKQLMVYEALGFEPPVFGHMTLICNENRKKLSKRDESIIQFIEQYEQLGYLPEALFNFIALLGWSPGGEEEIFSKDELIGMFDTARLSKSPAVFDTQKLEWLNNQYMKQQPLERIVELSLPHLVKAGRIEENLTPEKQEWVNRLAGLFKDQMSYGAEIVSLSELFFTDEVHYDAEAEEVLAGETVPQVMESFLAKVQESDTLEPDDVKTMLKAVQKETGQKGKNLFMPVRVAATGQVHGPDLLVSIALLGKERVVSRLENVIEKISKA